MAKIDFLSTETITVAIGFRLFAIALSSIASIVNTRKIYG